MKKNGSPYATIETDEDRTFFLIDIPCHPDFLKKEEVVTTLSQPVSTLYQAWMQAMDEVMKNASTDSPERILTLCLNLVTTLSQALSQPTHKAINDWHKQETYLNVLKLLYLLSVEMSMKDLLRQTGQTNRGRLLYNYVKPLLELELIKMKYPDNPHHHAQKYVLTEIGKMLLERLKS